MSHVTTAVAKYECVYEPGTTSSRGTGAIKKYAHAGAGAQTLFTE